MDTSPGFCPAGLGVEKAFGVPQGALRILLFALPVPPLPGVLLMNGSTPPSWLPNIGTAVEEAGDRTVASSGLIGLLTGNSLCPLPTPSDMIFLLAPGAHAESTLLVVPSGCCTTTFDPFSLSTLEGPCGGFSPTTPPPLSCSKPLQNDPSISTVNCHFPWCRCLRGHQLGKRHFTDANY